MSSVRRHRLSSLVVAAALLCTHALAHAVDEPSLKAAFIYNFGAFTTWPAAQWDAHAEPTLCIEPDVDAKLRRALASLDGKLLHERPLRVRTLAARAPITACLLLVRAAPAPGAAPRAPVPAGVLTVCDCPAGDDNASAMFHLVLRGTHLQFEVDREAATDAGLAISSRLLRLATTTR
jgi:hypothetical protein